MMTYFIFLSTICLLWTVSVSGSTSEDAGPLSCLQGCPPGWTFWGQHCYRYFSLYKTWREAESYCNQFGTVHDGAEDTLAHLVSIHSELENAFVRALWESQRPASSDRKWCWIGLNDHVEEGTWVWTDQTETDFLKWGDGQPNSYGEEQECAALDTSQNGRYFGGWDDGTCPSTAPAMCKMVPFYKQGSCGRRD